MVLIPSASDDEKTGELGQWNEENGNQQGEEMELDGKLGARYMTSNNEERTSLVDRRDCSGRKLYYY